MPKNIFVSNSGSYGEISASYGDNGELSSSYKLTLNTASYVGQSSIMQIRNGQLIPVATTSSVYTDPDGGTYSGSVLSYYGSVGLGPNRKDVPGFSGDISGTLESGIKVVNVSNVTGGILSSLYGGTGTGSFNSGSLVTTSGSGPVYSLANNNKIVAVTGSNGEWGYLDPSYLNFTPMTGAIVYLYTGSVGSSTVGTWKKPAGCRFIRVICQGGGGGGASGYNGGTWLAGGGGAGGGYADITLDALSFPDANINIVAGGGGAAQTTRNTNGNTGTSSSFGSYVYSSGGAGGNKGISASPGAASSFGGGGYSSIGGNGGGRNASGFSVNIGAPGGGSGTEGASVANSYSISYAGGGINNYGISGPPSVFFYYTSSVLTVPQYRDLVDGDSFSYYFIKPNSYFLNGTGSINYRNDDFFPKLISTGGSGGNANFNNSYLAYRAEKPGSGGSPEFGSGGGGGGNYLTSTNTNLFGDGGAGGKGYVLIICT